MKEIDSNKLNDLMYEQSVPAFGYELLREVLLTDMLGKEASQILYWAGKNLARKFPLSSIDEVVTFFQQAGWGDLSIYNTKKNEMEIHLSSSLISQRLQKKESTTFQLEAGFLAEQLEQQTSHVTEAFEQQKKRALKVIFTVKWDERDLIEK